VPLLFIHRTERLHDTVKIALVGKYTDLQDSYISVTKSILHAAIAIGRKLVIEVGGLV
jgi:CTP synthase